MLLRRKIRNVQGGEEMCKIWDLQKRFVEVSAGGLLGNEAFVLVALPTPLLLEKHITVLGQGEKWNHGVSSLFFFFSFFGLLQEIQYKLKRELRDIDVILRLLLLLTLRGSRFYRDEVSVETEQIELDYKFPSPPQKSQNFVS